MSSYSITPIIVVVMSFFPILILMLILILILILIPIPILSSIR